MCVCIYIYSHSFPWKRRGMVRWCVAALVRWCAGNVAGISIMS